MQGRASVPILLRESVDDLVDAEFDDATCSGEFQRRDDRADQRLIDDRVDVHPIGIGQLRDRRHLQRRQLFEHFL